MCIEPVLSVRYWKCFVWMNFLWFRIVFIFFIDMQRFLFFYYDKLYWNLSMLHLEHYYHIYTVHTHTIYNIRILIRCHEKQACESRNAFCECLFSISFEMSSSRQVTSSWVHNLLESHLLGSNSRLHSRFTLTGVSILVDK